MPNRSFTASTTVQQSVAYNAQRSSLLIRNASGNPVYISNDPSNVVSEGWLLSVGDFIAFVKRDGDDTAAAVYAATAALTADLRIVESFGKVEV